MGFSRFISLKVVPAASAMERIATGRDSDTLTWSACNGLYPYSVGRLYTVLARIAETAFMARIRKRSVRFPGEGTGHNSL